ncbi:Diaminopimelate epimerase-like protein, partial [Myriangium duriaei CBS 260.36]
LEYHTYDVFTSTIFAGNPLAVIHVPSSLPPSAVPQQTRQLLAREFNYSETVVLSLPSSTSSTSPTSSPNDASGASMEEVPTFPVQIFLVDAEVPLAGHPVIGTAVHIFTRLLPKGTTRAALQTKAGLCPITYDTDTGRVGADMPHDLHQHSWRPTAEELGAQQPALAAYLKGEGSGVEALGVDVLSLVKGMTFVYVRLPSVEALGRVGMFQPRLEPTVLDEGWREGVLMMMFYVVLGEAEEEGGRKIRTRMIEGTFEDPATGSASCGLAVLLSLKSGEGGRWEMVQAVEIGRRSEIAVKVDMSGEEVKRLELGGTAVGVMQGRV